MNTINKHEEMANKLKKFSMGVLKFVKILPQTEENKIYRHQVIRSSSSIGANYAEALCAHTKLDFLHDINKCRKESNETVYWLELIYEAKQLFIIFMSSIKTAKENIYKKS